jgi:hypothetical protein
MHPFDVDEQGLTGMTALAARGFIAIARASRKLRSAGASTDRCPRCSHVSSASDGSDRRLAWRLPCLSGCLGHRAHNGHGRRFRSQDAGLASPPSPAQIGSFARPSPCGAQDPRCSVGEAFAPAPVVDSGGGQRFAFAMLADMAPRWPKNSAVANGYSPSPPGSLLLTLPPPA